MTHWFRHLNVLLHIHRNKYEHPREQLIILVHWTFLSRDFRLGKDDGFDKPMKWIKNENNSIDMDYFQEDFVIHVQQRFDNGNYSIEFKMDENNQLRLEMPINDHIDENDGSLKDADEFIGNIGNEIYELALQKKEMDRIKKKIATTTTKE